MGQVIGGRYIPGPNDHHIETKLVDGKEVVSVEPGLGQDEPSIDTQAAAKHAGKEHIERMREVLKAEAEELEGKAESLGIREDEIKRAAEDLESKARALADREAELVAREKALAAGQ